MSLILFAALGLVGFVSLFFAPWVGGALLLASLVGGIVVFAVSLAGADEETAVAHEDPPAPHLPGPGNPESGVD
jgi:hypothetical protein